MLIDRVGLVQKLKKQKKIANKKARYRTSGEKYQRRFAHKMYNIKRKLTNTLRDSRYILSEGDLSEDKDAREIANLLWRKSVTKKVAMKRIDWIIRMQIKNITPERLVELNKAKMLLDRYPDWNHMAVPMGGTLKKSK